MNYEYKTVLIAVDGSDISRKAFDRALQIAKRDNAKLVLAHVIDTKYDSQLKPYLDVEEAFENTEQRSIEMVSTFEQAAKDADFFNLKKIIKVGPPKEILLEKIIPEENVELVVLGATGLSAIERILIGSVSEYVYRYAKCDVLVVR